MLFHSKIVITRTGFQLEEALKKIKQHDPRPTVKTTFKTKSGAFPLTTNVMIYERIKTFVNEVWENDLSSTCVASKYEHIFVGAHNRIKKVYP
jgi:hypothetical protein